MHQWMEYEKKNKKCFKIIFFAIDSLIIHYGMREAGNGREFRMVITVIL